MHAVAAYYLSLQQVRLHLAQAQAAARDAELPSMATRIFWYMEPSSKENRPGNAIARALTALRTTSPAKRER